MWCSETVGCWRCPSIQRARHWLRLPPEAVPPLPARAAAPPRGAWQDGGVHEAGGWSTSGCRGSVHPPFPPVTHPRTALPSWCESWPASVASSVVVVVEAVTSKNRKHPWECQALNLVWKSKKKLTHMNICYINVLHNSTYFLCCHYFFIFISQTYIYHVTAALKRTLLQIQLCKTAVSEFWEHWLVIAYRDCFWHDLFVAVFLWGGGGK